MILWSFKVILGLCQRVKKNKKNLRATGGAAGAGQLSGHLDALGNNYSTVEVIQLEGESPDRQILYHKLCLKN